MFRPISGGGGPSAKDLSPMLSGVTPDMSGAGSFVFVDDRMGQARHNATGRNSEMSPDPTGSVHDMGNLGNLGLPELLREIHPSMFKDMTRDAPEVMTALLRQGHPSVTGHASTAQQLQGLGEFHDVASLTRKNPTYQETETAFPEIERQSAMKRASTDPSDCESPFASGADFGDEDPESKKQMRAERNRQSAAASRERKKSHIRELERRVAALSQENAQLQVEQLEAIRSRIGKERELLSENRKLKDRVVHQDMKIAALTKRLTAAGIKERDLKRPSTWSAGEWNKK
mmetsp:Transcript_18668/g.39256  ORF Transcript_18668/g.39256 Transcript_18668/m.39256 type:complete len:288 (+) Transcript_18668:117-980(+)